MASKFGRLGCFFGETTVCMSHIRNKTEVAPDMLTVFSRLVQKEKSYGIEKSDLFFIFITYLQYVIRDFTRQLGN